MSDFAKAIDTILKHEGGLSNHSDDPGGLTKYGISKAAFPELDIANLTLEQAKDIYLTKYWEPYHFSWIDSQRVATKVFDMAVNMGPVPAVRILQHSLSTFIAGPLVADGKIGMQTANACKDMDEDKLMDEIKARSAKYYCDLQKPQFLLGWLRRAVEG